MTTRLGFGSATSVLAALVVAGCGGPAGETAVLTGKVTLRGKAPTPGMTVSFVAPDGKVVTSPLAPDGGYTAEVTPGELKVSVGYPPPEVKQAITAADEEAARAEGEKERKALLSKKGPRGVPKKAPGPAPVVYPFPARFLDPTTSGLVVNAEPGKENAFSVDLK